MNPDVLDYLCALYRHVPRADILACWRNASRYWIGLNPVCKIQEPPELTAARTLFVHSQLDSFAEDRASYSGSMWALVSPYCTHKL